MPEDTQKHNFPANLSLSHHQLFEKLKRLNPSALSKLVPMYGDCMQLRLGMSPEDIQRLRNVSVVFHLAASVRFDDPLKDAILTNVLSTRELFELCLGMKALRAVVHVSTAYSNPEQTQVDERVSFENVGGFFFFMMMMNFGVSVISCQSRLEEDAGLCPQIRHTDFRYFNRQVSSQKSRILKMLNLHNSSPESPTLPQIRTPSAKAWRSRCAGTTKASYPS